MEQTCERALALGLPAIAFTEHADHTRWRVVEGSLDGYPHLSALVVDGTLVPPPLDVDGYLECILRCRDRFPSLRIVSGVELGEPHWHADSAAALLKDGQFDRVLGSLHCLRVGDQPTDLFEIADVYRGREPGDVVRAYLGELPRLIDGFGDFAVLAHIDYAVRDWPAGGAAFEPTDFEEQFRVVLRALAANRSRVGAEHPRPDEPGARALVVRCRWRGGVVRKRRSRSDGARASLCRRSGNGRGVRIPSRPPPVRLLDSIGVSGRARPLSELRCAMRATSAPVPAMSGRAMRPGPPRRARRGSARRPGNRAGGLSGAR